MMTTPILLRERSPSSSSRLFRFLIPLQFRFRTRSREPPATSKARIPSTCEEARSDAQVNGGMFKEPRQIWRGAGRGIDGNAGKVVVGVANGQGGRIKEDGVCVGVRGVSSGEVS